MQRVFHSTGFLDKKALEYGLNEDLLMENAAAALESAVMEALENRFSPMPPFFCADCLPTVLVVCGSGNNGADGYALARRIQGKILQSKIPQNGVKTCLSIQAAVYEARPPKTPACAVQAERAVKCGVPVYRDSPQSTDGQNPGELSRFTGLARSCAVLADCLFGSGLSGKPDTESEKLILAMNGTRRQNPSCFFLSCDIPSGLASWGAAGGAVFEAERTVTMGAYKTALFSDAAKDCVGSISVADLGISRSLFEKAGAQNSRQKPAETGAQNGAFSEKQTLCPGGTRNTEIPPVFLLEKSDLRLPVRRRQNVHKGTFGHAAILTGEKPGAANLACQAAFILGAGLVTAVRIEPAEALHGKIPAYAGFPPEIMHANALPAGETALCAGMGFGRQNQGADIFFRYAEKTPEIPCLIDADLLHHPKLPELLAKRGNLVLTPHPKEFASLLELCGFGSFTVSETASGRFELAAAFCARYPETTLLLKGANTLICGKDSIFINTFGTNCLAKGGSGDMLAGFLVSLLAQGYPPQDAAVNASLIHALAAQNTGAAYSLAPQDLFRAVREQDYAAEREKSRY